MLWTLGSDFQHRGLAIVPSLPQPHFSCYWSPLFSAVGFKQGTRDVVCSSWAHKQDVWEEDIALYWLLYHLVPWFSILLGRIISHQILAHLALIRSGAGQGWILQNTRLNHPFHLWSSQKHNYLSLAIFWYNWKTSLSELSGPDWDNLPRGYKVVLLWVQGMDADYATTNIAITLPRSLQK